MGDIEQKINNLSMMEQSIQQMTVQKNNFQSQLLEVQSALKELEGGDSYKIIGNFMFKKDSSELKKELGEKEQLLNARIKSFEKQEEEAEKKFKDLQQEVMQELSKKGVEKNE